MFTEYKTEYFAHGSGRGRILYNSCLCTRKDVVNPQKSQTNSRCSNGLLNQKLPRNLLRTMFLLRQHPYILSTQHQLKNEDFSFCSVWLTLRLLMSYIYGAPSKARNANVVYMWTYVWQR